MTIKIGIFYLFLFIFFSVAYCQTQGFDVKNLVPGKVYQSPPRNGYERLSIYCYKGVPKHLLHFWQTVRINLNIDGPEYESYVGHNSDEVLEEYDARRSSWGFNLPFWKKSDALILNPFNSSCVGIYTALDHSIYLHILRIDFWRFLQFLGGLFLFFAAKRLSSNPIFYYTCGISLGVSASFLVLVYFISKLFPKKPAVYGFLAGGWAIGMYLVRLIVSNLRTIALQYQHYVLAYFSISAILSFAICYRYGPVSNPRTMALIRWALQGAGLAAIFCSSQYSEASLAVVILILAYHNFPKSVIRVLVGAWFARFPPKQKLLTENEYHEEGARETIKALSELREYCSSPECNQWKTILRLKSPLRFAEFIEGNSHLTDEEMLEYEVDFEKPALTDDSESD